MVLTHSNPGYHAENEFKGGLPGYCGNLHSLTKGNSTFMAQGQEEQEL